MAKRVGLASVEKNKRQVSVVHVFIFSPSHEALFI